VAWLLWSGLSILLVLAILDPVNHGYSRVFLATAIPVLWLGAALLLRRRRRAAVGVLVSGLLPGLWLCLPGRDPDRSLLRELYVHHLRGYEGTRYAWGGEGRFGMDCSGLVRRALVDAQADLGLRTFNPRPVRSALRLWWNDCRARDLRDGWAGATLQLFRAEALDGLNDQRLEPGDLAVTVNGAHVLAHLGDNAWIEADPDLQRVVVLRHADQSNWLTAPVVVVRWTILR